MCFGSASTAPTSSTTSLKEGIMASRWAYPDANAGEPAGSPPAAVLSHAPLSSNRAVRPRASSATTLPTRPPGPLGTPKCPTGRRRSRSSPQALPGASGAICCKIVPQTKQRARTADASNHQHLRLHLHRRPTRHCRATGRPPGAPPVRNPRRGTTLRRTRGGEAAGADPPLKRVQSP
jgi:hypothetical protein